MGTAFRTFGLLRCGACAKALTEDEALFGSDGGYACQDCSGNARVEERIRRGLARRRRKLQLGGLALVMVLCVVGWWQLRTLPAVQAYWLQDSLMFEGGDARGMASIDGTDYLVTLEVPAGTRITIDGHQLITDGTWRYAIDRNEVIRDTPLAELAELGVGTDTTLTVKLPRRPANQLPLPALTDLRGVGSQLRRVADGRPFLFTGESKVTETEPSILLLQSDRIHMKNVVGEARTLGTIGFIAIPEEATIIDGSICNGLPTRRQQAKLRVYDRRDARVVLEGLVRAEQSCPPPPVEDPFAEPVLHSLRREDYLAWLRSHRAEIH